LSVGRRFKKRWTSAIPFLGRVGRGFAEVHQRQITPPPTSQTSRTPPRGGNFSCNCLFRTLLLPPRQPLLQHHHQPLLSRIVSHARPDSWVITTFLMARLSMRVINSLKLGLLPIRAKRHGLPTPNWSSCKALKSCSHPLEEKSTDNSLSLHLLPMQLDMCLSIYKPL